MVIFVYACTYSGEELTAMVSDPSRVGKRTTKTINNLMPAAACHDDDGGHVLTKRRAPSTPPQLIHPLPPPPLGDSSTVVGVTGGRSAAVAWAWPARWAAPAAATGRAVVAAAVVARSQPAAALTVWTFSRPTTPLLSVFRRVRDIVYYSIVIVAI